jgi:hypothetical protein
MTEESIIIAPSLEESEESQESNDFEFETALNTVAMNTLTFMNEQVANIKTVPEDQQVEVMFNSAKAILFNIMMHISESAQMDPRELLQHVIDELTSAIESMDGGCCGGGEHHHH